MIEHPAPGVPYDDLPRDKQAVVRAWWDQEIERTRASLNLAEIFDRARQSYVSVDDDGTVIPYRPGQEPAEITLAG